MLFRSVNAKILLGDWYAAHRSVPNAAEDRRALSLWLEAAEAGDSEIHPSVTPRIMKFVREGRGFHKDDTVPIDFVRSAATAGNAEAAMMMADIYEEGRYVEQSSPSALSWLRNLASNVNAPAHTRSEAQRRMAEMFAAGRGSPQSDSAARTWFERSAALGNALAMKSLAEFLETGRGSDSGNPDPEAAHLWRSKAETAEPPPEPEDSFPFISAVRASAAAFNENSTEK